MEDLHMYYGWKAKIGLIIPSTGSAPERDFNRYAPDGVAIFTQRVSFEKVDHDGLSALGDLVVEASRLLVSAEPDLLVFGCTTGSLIKGAGYDKELIERIESASGIHAITTSTALLEALKALGAHKIVVSTPYSDSVNATEKQFLEDNGFEVLGIQGLGYTDPRMMPRTTFDKMYKLSKAVLNSAADTVFASCTGLGIIDYIPTMEQDFSRPVITSNQVSIWYALRSLGIRDRLNLGHLFDL